MKNRDIILDFTSLLDVILIILFFFVIFSRFDNNKENNRIKEEAQQAIAQADEKMEEAEALEAKAENALAELEQADERKAKNIDAIMSFSNNEYLKLNLYKTDSKWKLDFILNGDTIYECEYQDDMSYIDGLQKALDNAEMNTEDTILCEMFYDAQEAGSHKHYESIINAFEVLRKDRGYQHIYYSETDLSVLKEEEK